MAKRKKKAPTPKAPGPSWMRLSLGEHGSCEQLVKLPDGRQPRLARPPGNGAAYAEALLTPAQIRQYRLAGLVVEPRPDTPKAPKGDLSEPQT